MEPNKTHVEEVEKSGLTQDTQLIDTQTEVQVAEPHLNWRVIPVTIV